MRGALGGRSVTVVQFDIDDPVLCALVVDGGVIRVALNTHHGTLALSHAEQHIARGIDDVQVCSIGCAD